MGFPGIQDACGNAVAQTVCLKALFGDFNGDSAVNASDLILVRNNLNKVASATNFTADVNVDGAVNASDLILVRNNLNKAIMVTCP